MRPGAGDAGSLAARDSSRFGTVIVDESCRFVTGFREKDGNDSGHACWLNAGAYVMERKLLDLVPAWPSLFAGEGNLPRGPGRRSENGSLDGKMRLLLHRHSRWTANLHATFSRACLAA